MRTGMLVGLVGGIVGFAVVTALQNGPLMLLLLALIPLFTGAVAARQAWAQVGRGGGVGAAAGAVMGVLAAIALIISAVAIGNNAELRRLVEEQLAKAEQSNVSVDSIIGLVLACIGCLYLLIIPSITAGLGALGGLLYGLTRPKAAAPPPPPPYYMPPPGPPSDAGDTQRL